MARNEEVKESMVIRPAKDRTGDDKRCRDMKTSRRAARGWRPPWLNVRVRDGPCYSSLGSAGTAGRSTDMPVLLIHGERCRVRYTVLRRLRQH